MTWCPLMEGTREVRSIPNRQSSRKPRRRPSLDKIFLKQGGKQLRIRHRDWIIPGRPLNMIMQGELLGSLLPRPLLILLLGPLLELWQILRNCQQSYQGT